MIISRIKLYFLLFLLALPQILEAQKVNTDEIKRLALSHMQAGQFGEAIDHLNNYITANPQESDGYNLRGLCYEKRQQYANGRLDYRRAIAIESKSAAKRAEYEKNLQRLIGIWYPLLNRKIEGHLREIAIDASKPFNYLEIGKSYMLMEIWDKAEDWYDRYLARDDNASPDEIIRYTEVLARTGSIVKGERILKKYVERFPTDWRLWSRYGYFTMWLGKYAISKKAFETALGFKPFYKEAQDGLDQVTNQAYLTQESPRAFEKEYPIDRYYRILRKTPDDIETRFKLIDELINAERIEEAYQQLLVIGSTKPEDERYKEKYDYVTEFRSKTYRERLDSAKVRLLNDSSDKEALKLVAEYYEYLQEFDSARVILDQYFEQYPDEKDPALRYRWARIASTSREFDKAIEITDKLIIDDPGNLEYQLFRAQVAVWINRDIELSQQYLENVLKSRPNSIAALVSMGSIKLVQRDFEAAQDYSNRAKEIDPTNEDVIKLQSNIDWQKMRFEEEKLYTILEQGREKVIEQDYLAALPFYEDYLSKAEPNNLILKEYGDVLFQAKNYTAALDTYNKVLSFGDNYEAQKQRAALYFTTGDSLQALSEYKDLVRQDSTDFEANLYLGDSYAKLAENDSARTIYNNLLDWRLDSTQVSIVEQHKKWLPVTGIAAIFETFPSNIGFAPSLSYYSDNVSFSMLTAGGRLELGVTNFLSIGGMFSRSSIKAKAASLNLDALTAMEDSGNPFSGQRLFTTFKGLILLRLGSYINMGVGLGISGSLGNFTRDDQDFSIAFEKADTIRVGFNYQNSDAVIILNSPYLIDTRYYASLYKVDSYYRNREGLRLSGYFQYIRVDDDNAGNDFSVRLGKYFWPDIALGYEYLYSNYKRKSDFYYSPRNFESHSLWLENDLDKQQKLKISIGGKIGLIPQSSLIALEGHISAQYTVFNGLTLSGRISVGSASRDNSSYRYFSGSLSAYWSIL
ncbi:MAG: tetratricopeptide repeat protein [Melioribacteraceae bacterium]